MPTSRAAFVCLLLLAPAFGVEPADPLRPAAVQTQEVPAVPPELATRLQQYQNTRGAGFAGWDPAGDGILIRTRFGNSLQLHRVYQPGGRREQVTFFQEPVDGGFLPEAKDEAMLLSASAGGNENNQIYLFEPKQFRTRLITDGKSRNFVNAVKRDGSQMVVTSNKRNGRDTDLYVVNPREPEKWDLLMQVEKEFWSALDWSPDGSQLLLERTVSANESYLYVRDMKTGDRTPIPHPGPADRKEPAAAGSAVFTKDGKQILLTSDAVGEFQHLWLFDPVAGTSLNLSPNAGGNVVDIELDPKTGAVAYVVSANGVSQMFYAADVRAAVTQQKKMEIPTGIVSSLEFSPQGDRLGFTLNRPDATADAYSLEIATGKLTRWTFSEVGGLNPATFVTAKAIEFPSFDERKIPAWYYQPKSASADKKVPVLIQIHGGPEGQSQPYFSGTTQFYVNDLGVAVILPNVRGSTGYGKTYLKLDNAEKREDSVKDIGALLDWIKEQPELDASRVAVVGGSYGGYMVLASLVHYGDRIKAGIDIVGIANFITFLETTASYRVDLRRVEYGDERDPEMRKVLERISPANHADQIRSALMVAHGVNDPRVPFSEAQQIAAKVRAQGRPVWTVFAENEGHGFGKKDNADYLRAVEAMFLMKVFELK